MRIAKNRSPIIASRKAGFSLLEILIALMITAATMVGLFVAVAPAANRPDALREASAARAKASRQAAAPDLLLAAVTRDWPAASEKVAQAQQKINRCAISQDCLRGDGEAGPAGAPAKIDLALMDAKSIECEAPACQLSPATRVSVSPSGEISVVVALVGGRKGRILTPKWTGREVAWTQEDISAAPAPNAEK